MTWDTELNGGIHMASRMNSMRAFTEWIEPIPRWAGPDWCLPAVGGRVVIRGYDTSRSSLTELEWPWALDETLVPLSAATASRTDGPGGEVHPGDCVVFIGMGEQWAAPIVWFPQRVIHVAAGPVGWQRVWAIRDIRVEAGSGDAVSPTLIPRRLLRESALHGDSRRRVLELFGLNVECPSCGSHGEHIYYGPIVDPMPPSIMYGGGNRREGDHTYGCHCTARWTVARDGSLTLQRPMAIM